MKKHDIECKTIGIDRLEEDIEVDIFLRKNIYEIKNMDNITDVVYIAIFTIMHSENKKWFFSDKTIFKQCVENCGKMLKKPMGNNN